MIDDGKSHDSIIEAFKNQNIYLKRYIRKIQASSLREPAFVVLGIRD